MNKIFLSIIICTLNRRKELLNCLCELVEQAVEFSDVEIIIVDNGSTDGTEEAVRKSISNISIPCSYVYEGRPGLSNARNAGRSKARGEVLAYIDDDAIPHSDWVKRVREHFLTRSSDCLAGRVMLKLETSLPEWFPSDLLWILGESRFGEQERMLTEEESPQGQNFALKARVFDVIGGFDPRIRLYCDEVEFFRRVRARGFTIAYRPDIAVDHFVSTSRLCKKALRRKAFMMGQGAAVMQILRSSDLLNRLGWATKYFLLASRVGLAWFVRPRFDREFTFYFDLGYLYRILSGE